MIVIKKETKKKAKITCYLCGPVTGPVELVNIGTEEVWLDVGMDLLLQ